MWVILTNTKNIEEIRKKSTYQELACKNNKFDELIDIDVKRTGNKYNFFKGNVIK